MADHAGRDHQESMYCHACHHQWQRQGETIECPMCGSASTEIVTPENDPRHFHRPQREGSTSSSVPDAAPIAAHNPTAAAESTDRTSPRADSPNTSSNNNPDGPGARPAGDEQRHGHRRNGPPNITFITIVSDPGHAHAPLMPPWIDFYNLRFIVPPFQGPPPPPPTGNNSTPVGPEVQPQPQPQQQQAPQQPQQATQQPQQPPQQPQPQSQPHNVPPRPTTPYVAPAVFPGVLIGRLFASLFDPTAAVFGDAVFTQEALDQVIAQLGEQHQARGPPPASEPALEKLQSRVRELDEKMLAKAGCSEGKAKCVICVDDMAAGEKVSVLPCSHFFHGDCVLPWLKLHNTCPVCRRSVEEEEQGKGDPAKPVVPPAVGVDAPMDTSEDNTVPLTPMDLD